jgi:predicted O-methyltransferase YrrM
MKALLRVPLLGALLLFAYRGKVAAGYLLAPLAPFVRWWFRSRETTNFTYHLEPYNRECMAAMIAHALAAPHARVLALMDEVEGDAQLREHVRSATRASARGAMADDELRLARRAGWYAIVRLQKPRVVVETGVDKGLGACVLAAALRRNAAEGAPGRYYGTDINPEAGYLLAPPYSEHGEILYGDSIESLRRLPGPIDLFINDSDHSFEYEAEEYRTVAGKLSAQALIIGDNAYGSPELLRFSLAQGRPFTLFTERPHQHWIPGCGLGLSLPPPFPPPRSGHAGLAQHVDPAAVAQP